MALPLLQFLATPLSAALQHASNYLSESYTARSLVSDKVACDSKKVCHP